MGSFFSRCHRGHRKQNRPTIDLNEIDDYSISLCPEVSIQNTTNGYSQNERRNTMEGHKNKTESNVSLLRVLWFADLS